MCRFHPCAVTAAICLSFLFSNAWAAEPEADDIGFLRLRRGDSGEPLALETAIAQYRSTAAAPSLSVDLIGAVHIADQAYFDELNRAFTDYDVVLYELVAQRDTKPTPGSRSAHPVSFLQLTMKNMLSLQFQLDCVDYSQKNFVHADMTPEEFAASMEQRGESMLQVFLRMFGQSIAMQARDPERSGDAQLLSALLAKPERRALQLKRVMAEQFQDLEATTKVLDGAEGSTILTERNKAALGVLRQQVDGGAKKVAIFYGAAHLPDMEARLVKDFQLQRSGTKWLTAWNLAAVEGTVPKP